MRCHFRLKKPLFFPLNYGDRSQRSAADVRDQNVSLGDFTSPTPSFAKRCFAFDGRREAELSIILFSGKLITCPPTLKSKFSSKSRMSFSSTLLVTPSFQ